LSVFSAVARLDVLDNNGLNSVTDRPPTTPTDGRVAEQDDIEPRDDQAEGLNAEQSATDEETESGATSTKDLIGTRQAGATDNGTDDNGDPGGTSQTILVFAESGDGYDITAFNETGHFVSNRAKGLNDIFRLIQTPDVPVPMLELDAGLEGNKLPGDRRTKQPAANAETVRDLRAKRAELIADIEEAKSDLERDELEAKLKELNESARKLFDKEGRPRELNDQHEALRSRIRKRLNNAFSTLAMNAMPITSQHLYRSITAEKGHYVYRPGEKSPEWQIRRKSNE